MKRLAFPLPYFFLPPFFRTCACTAHPIRNTWTDRLLACSVLHAQHGVDGSLPRGLDFSCYSILTHPCLPQFPKQVTAKREGSLPDFCSTPSQNDQPILTPPSLSLLLSVIRGGP